MNHALICDGIRTPIGRYVARWLPCAPTISPRIRSAR